MRNKDLKYFLGEYNELLSKAALEHKGKFGALASPTLNKQETVTFLYRDVINIINDKTEQLNRENPIRLRIKFPARLGYRFFQLIKTSTRFRIRSIPNKCIYIRTWLVPRSINDGIVKDDYFRKLVDDLSEKHKVVVGFQPLEYGKTLNQFFSVQKPENFIIPVGLLSILDIIELFLNYIITAKIRLKGEYLFKDKDVCSVINDSLRLDYYKLRSFQGYLELSIAKKIKKYKPEIFLYIFENQAWENAYLYVFKRAKTRTIGYQSSGFSFRFLNFFPSKLDASHCFFPDKLLTVGDLFTKLLKDYAHYPIPIQTFAALRFNYTTENGKYKVEESVPEIHKRILYAFAVHIYQYENIIKDLIDVFGDTDVKVHLKFHPLYNGKKFTVNLPANFCIVESIQMRLLKDNYDLVLFNDSSFGLEALMGGVMSFEYEIVDIYDETRMLDFNLYPYKLKKSGLTLIKESILNETFEKRFSVQKTIDYINYSYKAYTSPELIISALC